MFSCLASDKEPIALAFEWGCSHINNLTHFSALAGVMLYCACGDCMPAVLGLLIGLVLILARLCLWFWKECKRLRKADGLFYLDIHQAQMYMERMERHRKNELVCRVALKKIKKALECPVSLCVPEDPMVTSSGYVYSDAMLKRFPLRGGFYICPMTRMPLSPLLVQRCYPVETVCAELRMMGEMV